MSDRTRYWQRQVSAWGNSGLSQAEFCRRRRIKAVTFGWWERERRLGLVFAVALLRGGDAERSTSSKLLCRRGDSRADRWPRPA